MSKIFDFSNPWNMIYVFIGAYVGIEFITTLLPTLILYLVNISNISGLGFVSFFASGGIIYTILGAGLLIGILKLVGFGKARKGM